MKLFLVGYSGCGKSSLGRRTAKRLNVAYADTDAEVERSEGAAVADIFKYAGEEYFRKAERDALERIVADGRDMVVSTGGGLPVWGDNMKRLNECGRTVYICRTAEQIARRLSPYGREKRPRFRGLNDEELVAFMTRDIAGRDGRYREAGYVLDGSVMNDNELTDRLIKIFDGESYE